MRSSWPAPGRAPTRSTPSLGASSSHGQAENSSDDERPADDGPCLAVWEPRRARLGTSRPLLGARQGGARSSVPSLDARQGGAGSLMMPDGGPRRAPRPLRRYALLVDQEFYLRVEEQRQPGGVLDGGAGQEAAMQAIAAMKAAARKARS